MDWTRAIILIDMNAFFASIEQLDYPELRHRPIAVTNGIQGSCIITCSYEARAFGIKTGMPLYQAKKLCPDIIQRTTRPNRYSEISKRIMHALTHITPEIEVFSVDEAFLDVTPCQKLFGSPERIAKMAKNCVWQASHLPCSLGLSGDKTTAKYAAKKQKPDGFTIIHPDNAKAALEHVPVTELCGINKGIAGFLAQYNIHFCGDVATLPISVLAKRFGNIGRRIWFMCQGLDPEPLNKNISAPKSMGHGKVLPPRSSEKERILVYLLHMSERLAARLRRHQFSAQVFWIGLCEKNLGWLGEKIKLVQPSHDGQDIYHAAQYVAHCHLPKHFTIVKVQITALDPKLNHLQQDLFLNDSPNRENINNAVDDINERFGEFCIAPASLLNRSKTPNVIAPAWKPQGPRQSI